MPSALYAVHFKYFMSVSPSVIVYFVFSVL